MARRRIVVGFVQIETVEQRIFRHAWGGLTVDEIVAEPRHVRLVDGDGNAYYWCGADKPHESIPVAPVHRTTKVPEDAECQECGISIRDLQDEMTRMFS